MAANPSKARKDEVPDLQTQLEGIFNAVWASEAEWRLDDRITLSLAVERKRKSREENA
jgi:hypothetical protein